jgi:hypothetical protein
MSNNDKLQALIDNANTLNGLLEIFGRDVEVIGDNTSVEYIDGQAHEGYKRFAQVYVTIGDWTVTMNGVTFDYLWAGRAANGMTGTVYNNGPVRWFANKVRKAAQARLQEILQEEAQAEIAQIQAEMLEDAIAQMTGSKETEVADEVTVAQEVESADEIVLPTGKRIPRPGTAVNVRITRGQAQALLPRLDLIAQTPRYKYGQTDRLRRLLVEVIEDTDRHPGAGAQIDLTPANVSILEDALTWMIPGMDEVSSASDVEKITRVGDKLERALRRSGLSRSGRSLASASSLVDDLIEEIEDQDLRRRLWTLLIGPAECGATIPALTDTRDEFIQERLHRTAAPTPI